MNFRRKGAKTQRESAQGRLKAGRKMQFSLFSGLEDRSRYFLCVLAPLRQMLVQD